MILNIESAVKQKTWGFSVINQLPRRGPQLPLISFEHNGLQRGYLMHNAPAVVLPPIIGQFPPIPMQTPALSRSTIHLQTSLRPRRDRRRMAPIPRL